MTLRSITLMLPNELITQLQQLVTDSPDALHQFVIEAIEHELQRRQRVSRQQAFWAKVETIRAQMTTEGIEVNPDEIWGDVRDRYVGQKVVL
jgi:predicted transcriptional regulator